jgi:O-antigen/teichoic acid export membrane protein
MTRVRGPLAWSMSTDASAKAATLVTTFVTIRALAPRQFGQLIGLYAAGLLAASVWDFGVSALVTREVASGRVSVAAAFAGALRLRLKMAPIWLVCFCVAVLVLSRQGTPSPVIILALALDSILFATQTLLVSILRGRMHFAEAGLASAAGRWAVAGGALLSLTAVASQRLTILATAYAVGDAFTASLAFWLVRRGLSGSRHNSASVSLRRAVPFGANGILNIAYNRFDVIILAGLASAGQLALYAPASRLQDALYLIPSSLGLVALPILSEAIARGSDVAIRITRRVVTSGLAIAIPVTVFGFAFAPQAIAFVLGPSYAGAVLSTRILIWSLPLAVLQAPLIAELAARGHAGETTKIFLTAFIVAVLMHASLDWRFGATGAAIASLSREPAALIVGFILLVRIRRRVGLPPAQIQLAHEAI